MAAGDGVTLAAEVISESQFHGDGGFKGHGIVAFVEFGKEPDAMVAHNGGSFESVFVVEKALIRCEAGHADVDAGFGWIAVGVGAAKRGQSGRLGRKQNDINVMVMAGGGFGPDLSKGAAAHGELGGLF